MTKKKKQRVLQDAIALYVLPMDGVNVKESCHGLKGVTTVHKHGLEKTVSPMFRIKEFCIIKSSLLQQMKESYSVKEHDEFLDRNKLYCYKPLVSLVYHEL